MSDRHKIDQVLRFNPGTGRDRGPLHNVPILLSFICLLVREDDIDLSKDTTDIGEIYTRMVRCLYRKFTIRKGIEYKVSDFVNLLKLLGKLALETLLSENPLLKRKEVIAKVGEEAFDYGLLIGHEDAFRLIRDETKDIFVSFPHRTILEFLGSFGFVWRLSIGDNVKDILGIDCKEPVFLWNPLFLQFSLWFLETSDECFALVRKEEVYEKMVHYTAQLVDEEILDLRRVADRFSALKDLGYEAVSRYFGGVIAQCRKTKHLILDFDFCIDDVFSSFQSNLVSLESVEVYANKDVLGRSVLRRGRHEKPPFSAFHDPNTRSDLRIDIEHLQDRFQDGVIKTIVSHFQYLGKRFCFNIFFNSFTTDSLNLESFLDERIHVLDVSRVQTIALTRSLICKKQLPFECSKLTHLSLRDINLCDIVEGLSEALQSSKFPCLSHLRLADRKGRSGFLPRLFRVQCPTLIHLNLGSPLDEHDIDFLASVNSVDSERSILPKLSSLVLSESPFPDRLFQKSWTRIKNLTLTGKDECISGLCTVINKGILPNLAELNAQHFESYTATIRKLDPEKLPCLKSLTLNGYIHSIEEFEDLCSKVSEWDLNSFVYHDAVSYSLPMIVKYLQSCMK